jgi:hypothetical protein
MEIIPITKLKPLELVFPFHLKNLGDMITASQNITSPILADKDTGIVLDGSHRYAYLYGEGYELAPVEWVDYKDENIRVGTHLMHRHIIDGSTNISKAEVVYRGRSGNLFSPRTTRHFFPFRKNTFANVPLSQLRKGNKRDIVYLIAKVSVDEEIAHNRKYIEEIEFEFEEIIRYMEEVRQTKYYLKKQIEMMEKTKK